MQTQERQEMTFTKLAAAASIPLLLSVGATAEAKSREGRTTLSATPGVVVRDHRGEPRPPMRDANNGYGGGRIIRDHRKNPEPWSLPRHWHRH
jgi:hypothetical protein